MKYLHYCCMFIFLLGTSLCDIKIGYVDSNEIMTKFEEVRDVQIQLEKEQRKMQTEFESLVSSLDSLKRDYERQRLLMSESRRVEKENEILSMEQSIQQYQLDKFGQEGEIYRKQNELLKPVLAKIDQAIQKVGNERGYDFILDAMSGALLFALDAHNLTVDVMDELENATK